MWSTLGGCDTFIIDVTRLLRILQNTRKVSQLTCYVNIRVGLGGLSHPLNNTPVNRTCNVYTLRYIYVLILLLLLNVTPNYSNRDKFILNSNLNRSKEKVIVVLSVLVWSFVYLQWLLCQNKFIVRKLYNQLRSFRIFTRTKYIITCRNISVAMKRDWSSFWYVIRMVLFYLNIDRRFPTSFQTKWP